MEALKSEWNTEQEKILSKKKPTSEISREMREAAAKKSAKQPKGSQQPAPAKKCPDCDQPMLPKGAKKKPGEYDHALGCPRAPEPKKVAKGKKGAKSLTSDKEFMSDSALAKLKEDAARIDAQLDELASNAGSALNALTSQHALVEDFIERELWRWCPTPWVSEAAWIRDKNQKLGSAAKLFNIVSGYKALKGETTQVQREKMGPRKRAVATAAKKKAAKKGKPLPPEIIEKAADPEVTEPELKRAVVDADLGPEEETIISDNQETFPCDPRAGGSGIVEGAHESAQQFSGKIAKGIANAKALYLDPNQKPPMTDHDWLEWIVATWEESEVDLAQVLIDVDRESLAGMSNENAAQAVSNG